MSPGSTFERVYLGLKSRILSGTYRSGAPLEPKALGEELIASITPIRDALHRLVGERLVEAPRNDGFRVASLTEAALRSIYEWNLDLIVLALQRTRRVAAAENAAENASLPELALTLARRCNNPEILAAVSQTNDRLSAARVAEESILAGNDPELAHIRQALLVGNRPALKQAFVRYHRQRMKMVPAVIAVLSRSEPG